MFGQRKPNIILLDEIDGATSGQRGAIDSLLKWLNAKNSNSRRIPLICIANDQYAPALRSLRKHAKIVVIKEILKAHLIERLKVCI